MNFEVAFCILLNIVQTYVAFKLGMAVAEIRERNRREDRIKALGKFIEEMDENGRKEHEENPLKGTERGAKEEEKE